MSTSRPVKRCRNASSGVTVVELVIVLVIMGLLAILVSAPLQMTNQLSKTSFDRLSEAVDSNLSMRVFAQQFAGAQIARSPLIECVGLSNIFKHETVKGASLSLLPNDPSNLTPDPSKRFSMPYSSATSIGAIDPTTAGGVTVADITFFREGDFVVMVAAENSSIAGLFSVKKKDSEKAQLELQDATISDEGNDCSVAAGESTTLSEFKNLASTKGLNNVILMRFHVANYQVVGSSLMVRIFPQVLAGGQSMMFSERFEKFDLLIQWQGRQKFGTSNEIEDFNETEGSLWSTVTLQTLEPDERFARNQTTCEGIALGANDVCEGGRLFNRRVLKSSNRFVLSSTKTLNPKVQTSMVSKQNLFPTCYIKAESAGFKVIVPPVLNKFPVGGGRQLFKVTGAVSEKGLEQVNLAVNVSKRPGGAIQCINMDELKALRDPDLPIDPSAVKVFGDSFNLSGTSASMDEMLCSVAGGIEFTGRLTYYDPGTERSESIDCRERVGVVGGTLSTFDLKAGDNLSCDPSGVCNVPSQIVEVESGKEVPGKFWDNITCQWSDAQSRPCCDSLPSDPSVKMRSVSLIVTSVKMKDPSKLSRLCN